MEPLEPWSIRAVNLPEHANNAVHTDDGARAAGHERALVAGTTIHAYLTHVPAAAWGLDWLERGGGEVRFRSPVFDDDLVDIVPIVDDDRTIVEARSRGERRATLDVWLDAAEPDGMRGDPLPAFEVQLDGELAAYGKRAGDDLVLYEQRGIVHPVMATVLGNRATMASVVDGPWIHVRSLVTHRGTLPLGAPAVVESSLVERFATRAGERALLDVRIVVDGRVLTAIEHESIVRIA